MALLSVFSHRVCANPSLTVVHCRCVLFVVVSAIDVEAADLPAGDVLDQVKAYIEPLEASVTKDVLASREQRRALTELEERLAVLQVVSQSAGELAVTQNPSTNYGSFAEENPLLSVENDEHCALARGHGCLHAHLEC